MSYKHNFTFTSFIKNEVVFPENLEQLTKYLKSKHTIIGNLRSYGDTCVGKNSKHISLKRFIMYRSHIAASVCLSVNVSHHSF